MSAIPASSVNMKTMSDGTLRISFDIEPIHAQDAFKLFAAPGTQAAIAALKAGTYLEQQPAPEKPKGGELARLAGIWCNEPKFWRWIYTVTGVELDNDMHAATWIRNTCSVDSRIQLDHDEDAGWLFQKHVREPYMAYLKANP